MNRIDMHMDLNDIFKLIVTKEKKASNEKYYSDYTIIITGKPGPTGKTTLYKRLENEGFKVLEITELILQLVDFNGNSNYVVEDVFQKVLIIILNKELKKNE